MMKAIKNFMNKPWIWGTYFKLCGAGVGLSLAIMGALAIAWDKYVDKKNKELQEELRELNLKENI